MPTVRPPSRTRRVLRSLALLGLAWLLLVAVPTAPPVRSRLAAPLVEHVPDARGEAAYVLSGGPGLPERLLAAADLVHEGRAGRIYLEADPRRSRYNYVAKASWTESEWSVAWLGWLGVPRGRIELVPPAEGAWLGTRAEAQRLATALPPEVRRVVLVTSPAHTRRAALAFRRALPGRTVLPYAATAFEASAEREAPLWLEYAKLLVYLVAA